MRSVQHGAVTSELSGDSTATDEDIDEQRNQCQQTPWISKQSWTTEHEAGNTDAVATDGSLPPVICYRDPADVRTIRRQSRLLLLALFVTATAVVGVVYKSIQRPDRIVVDMSPGAQS
jgi:hypothetical protein